MLSVVAVSNRERAGGLMAEQNEMITGGMCGSSAVAVGEPTPRDAAHRRRGSRRRRWSCEQRRCSAHFHTELLLSCAALMLVSRHAYGLQTLMGCLDLGRPRSPSQM